MKHGLTAYSHAGCRCDTCREVWNAYQLDWYHRNKTRVLARQRAYYRRRMAA